MNDIVTKLLSDLAARLRGAGKFRPARKEIEGWGATQIPLIAPLFLFGAYLAFAILGSPQAVLHTPVWLTYLLFSWPGWIMFFFGFSQLHAFINRNLVLSAYRRLLKQNERFTLVEYCKYLERQIKRATKDQSMGGGNEVARLKQLHAKLYRLIRDGAADTGLPVASVLAEEADLAEAVIETYAVAAEDPLKGLDNRLPVELRQRIEELDQEAESQRTKLAE